MKKRDIKTHSDKTVVTDIEHFPLPEEKTPPMGYSTEDMVDILRAELTEMQDLYISLRHTAQQALGTIAAARNYFGEHSWEAFEAWRKNLTR